MVDEAVTPGEEGPTVTDGLALATASVDRVIVVTAKGTVDALTAPRLTAALDEALAEAPHAVIADLSEVDFLASAGMSVLIEAHGKAADSVRFGVVADGPATSRPMKLVGIHEIVPLYETLDEAMRTVGDA
jgi:anti-anti-sigma factor